MQILEHILKIRREKEKHEFSQTVGNQLATIWHCEIFFSHCEICNVVFALRNLQCGFRIAKFRIAKFAVVFRIAKFATHCEQFAN